MNNNAKVAIAFVIGAAGGYLVASYALKAKYETIAEEQIEKMREHYTNKLHELEEREGEPEEDTNPETLNTAMKRNPDLKELYAKYKRESDVEESDEEEQDPVDHDMPYIIDPDEYDDKDNFEAETLVYYADGTLATIFGNKVIDPECMVGEKALSILDDTDEEIVFVRNEPYMTDYEIMYDTRNYDEVVDEGASVAENDQ